MWYLRILNGPDTGKIFSLEEHQSEFVLGRSQSCDIVLQHSGISKSHCKITHEGGSWSITDLNSSNGTFVNGVKIQKKPLRLHDKIGLHDVLAEVIDSVSSQPISQHQRGDGAYPAMGTGAYSGNVAYQNHSIQQPFFHGGPQADLHVVGNHHTAAHNLNGANDPALHTAQGAEENPNTQTVPKGLDGILFIAKNYVDEVILPSIYKVTEFLEFRWVFALFIFAFIVGVTALSSIPLLSILKSGVEKESQRRALTIARALAKINRQALIQGMDSAVNISLAQREPGVLSAYIASNTDGNIIAPANLAGQYPKEAAVHKARQEAKETVQSLSGDRIMAFEPIEYYNEKVGSQAMTAYAVVIYDMSNLAVDGNQTLSLLIQTLFIALFLGGLLYFVLIKLVEFPLVAINKKLDVSLKNSTADISLPFISNPVQNLISNINSSLVRMSDPGATEGVGGTAHHHDKNQEMANLVQLVGFAALAIDASDLSITAVNGAFEHVTGVPSHELLYNTVHNLNDQSLKLSIEDLLHRAQEPSEQIASNELEFSGVNHELMMQSVWGKDSPAYFILVIYPKEVE